jgi:4-hydroxy-tetrahydrodipicolinate synthase
VDYPGLAKNIRWLVEQGVHGLIPLGSTGEMASLDDADRRKVVDTVVEAAGGKVPIMAGASAETTEKAIEYARYNKQAGASSVMILPPWYYTPEPEEIFDHYRRISDAVDIPILIYNNPWSSKVDIKPDLVARLAKLEHVKAIKESTADIKRITEIRTLTNDGITIFCGWEDMAYESFVHGATGWVCVIGNLFPKEAMELFDLVAEKKDLARGWALYKRMLPLLRYFEYSNKGPKAIKHVLDGMGLGGGYCSSPRLPLGEQDKAEVDRLVRELRGR